MPGHAPKVAIIGGGITGLAAALRLASHNIAIELFEAGPRLGGTLLSIRQEGFLLEGGPDCFISSKPRGVELCRELGLSDQLISTQEEFRRSFIVKSGILHPIPEGFYLLAPAKLRPFLSSPLLSWAGKWRALMEPLLPARPQADESLASFVRRRMGKEVLDWLAQPLLAGIYAADPERLSLRSTFPLFLEMEKKYGSVLLGLSKKDAAIETASGARYSLFVSLRDGMETLISKMSAKIPKESTRLQSPVKSLHRTENGWEIRLENGGASLSDAVCVCLSAPQTARLLTLADRSLSEQLASIPYTGSMTINMAFDAAAIRHPLNGIGFVTPQREEAPALACTFVHRKFAGRAPAGKALLRAFVGGHSQIDLLEKSDSALQDIVLQRLTRLLGITGQPLFTTIQRWPGAMPQYMLGHLTRLLKIEETALGLPGLSLAGNWQYGVGIPDCIESGERAADAALQSLRTLRT